MVAWGVREMKKTLFLWQTKPPPNTKKRQLTLDSDSDSELDNTTWPRFLIIHSTDENNNMNKLSPFVVNKVIIGLAGEPKTVKKLRSGDLLVEVTRRSHATNLLKTKIFHNLPVSVSPHRSLNTKKGVLRCRDLEGETDESIQKELKDQGVIAVNRIKVKRNGSLQSTHTFIITFNRTTLPTSLKVGYLNVKVDLFIPNPLRCFGCQRFGHHKNNCTAEPSCVRCGQQGHEDSQCTSTPSCVNCKGTHPANSKDCPKWITEKEIQKIIATKNISYPEARKIFETSQFATSGKSFAAVAKTGLTTSSHISTPTQTIPTRSFGTQTSISWLQQHSKTIEDEIIQIVQIHNPPVQSLNPSIQPTKSKPSPPQQQQKQQQQQKAIKPKPKPNSGEDVRPRGRRPPKGSTDPIKIFNKFGSLDGDDVAAMDIDCPASSPRRKKASGSKSEGEDEDVIKDTPSTSSSPSSKQNFKNLLNNV